MVCHPLQRSMELITLPVHAADGALCDSVRAVFHLQSQALKAALAQVDASQAQISALQQQINALRDGSQDASSRETPRVASRWSRTPVSYTHLTLPTILLV